MCDMPTGCVLPFRLTLNDCCISHSGDLTDLETGDLVNVRELDLAKNSICCWNEVIPFYQSSEIIYFQFINCK